MFTGNVTQRPAHYRLLYFYYSAVIWTLASGLETGAAVTATKYFWSKVEYIGATFSGVFWLSFAFRLHRFEVVAAVAFAPVPLWLFPLATVVLTWTNDLHHLVSAPCATVPGGSYFILIYEHGTWFWIMVAYMYLLFISGMVVLWRFIYRKPVNFRWQIAMLTIGTLIPLAGSVIYLLDLSPDTRFGFCSLHFYLCGFGLRDNDFPFPVFRRDADRTGRAG